MTPIYDGHTESIHRTEARILRGLAEYATNFHLRKTTEADADRLHELVTDPYTRVEQLNPEGRVDQIEDVAEFIDQTPLQSFVKSAQSHQAKQVKFVPKPDCAHDKTYPTLKGMFCRDCHTTLEPSNDFERHMAERLNPRTNDFVNYR